MVLPWGMRLLAVLLYYTLVMCQLEQDYIVRSDLQGNKEYWIEFEPGSSALKVINLKSTQVYLIYNCYYMREICKNAKAFLASSRGKNLHAERELDRSGIPTFAYDSSVGKGAIYRDYQRRQRSCPTKGSRKWRDNHLCPEVDQSKPMRQDGEWFTSALESGTVVNAIANEYDSNGSLLRASHIRYSCEEFPAASWVEGGDGINNNNPSFTRCAAITCEGAPKGTKAEQTWQSTAHAGLARALETAAEDNGIIWDRGDSIAFFKFMTMNFNNGVAAEVVTSNETHELARQEVFVDRDKRSVINRTESHTGEELSQARYALLMAQAATGKATRHVIHANVTEATAVDYTTPWTAVGEQLQGRWDLADSSLANINRTEPGQSGRRESSASAPLLQHATAATLQRAREVVAGAIAESARRNEARYQRPRRNSYRLKPGTEVNGGAVQQMQRRGPRHRHHRRQDDNAPPLLTITDEIAQAAALVAEADASTSIHSLNLTRLTRRQAQGTFWMESLERKGTVPWGDNSTYTVFRNVLDYGAKGDYVTDDTAAIKRAMNDGKRCGEKCNGSTTKNAIVYFPPGVYQVSSTIPLPFGTQVIGDPNDIPLIVASPSFVGLGVLSTDEYTGGGAGPDGADQEWFINTANFYRQLRNIRIDVTITNPAQKVACLHYQIAQATSTQNVELVAGAAQIGMFAENGSGGSLLDITFIGGAHGIYGGNQQFTAQRLTFRNCAIGVQIIWDWGWSWKSITMTDVGTGFKLVPEDGQSGYVGSASFFDSSFTNVKTAIEFARTDKSKGATGVILENVAFSGVTNGISTSGGGVLLDGATEKVEHFAYGPVYEGDGTRKFNTAGKVGNYRRAHQLTNVATGAYFERPKPQYETRPVSDFLHVKDFGAKGDGATDDTTAFQRALYGAQGKILFVDAGSYILKSTLKVPTGSRIVGETWSQLVAHGSYFEDSSKPKALLQVGEKGQIGTVELQDLIVTTKGPTAGAVLIEWNMKASAAGLAAMWDVHVRVGGATGTGLTSEECPALTSGVNPNCNAASLMMHITPSGSGYFENMWLWLSDHDIDDPDLNDAGNNMIQNSVYAARGFLIESTHATWLYATSSEHAVFYQYNFHKARNIFAGMIQTESPYYQPTPPPPEPFTSQVGVFPGDPEYTCDPNDEFSGCDQSWGLIIRGSSEISIAGAGLYSWFSTYTQTCIDTQECQKALVLLDGNSGSVRIQHLITIGAKYMAVMNGDGISAANNLNVHEHPFWSQISVLDATSDSQLFNDVIWIDPVVWDMAQPEFTCAPPCHVQLPPWTRATTTIGYPMLTVSSGTWTSTITKPPLTLSEWRFRPVTITEAGGARKREAFGDFYPVPAVTSSWPAVVYRGPNGSPTTVAPTVAVPMPPATIGPNALAPPEGIWPPVAMRAVAGNVASPVVDECEFWADGYDCEDDPTKLPGGWGGLGDPDDDYDENWPDLGTACPAKRKPTATVVTPPTHSPLAQPHPVENKVNCFDAGEGVDNADLVEVAGKFCGVVRDYADWWDGRPYNEDFTVIQDFVPSGASEITVTLTFILYKGCNWFYNRDDCMHYLRNPVDACNCATLNDKQGGTTWNNCLRFDIDPNFTGEKGGGSPFDDN